MKLLFLSLLLFSSSVESLSTETFTDPTIPPPTTTETIDTYDYIVEIGFNLIEGQIPDYLINIIYELPTNTVITTDDILTLYRLKTVDRITTLDFLRKLNISAERVFSLNGLDTFLTELRVDFKEFYNRVIIGRLNLTGNPLRDVLLTLNINSASFSEGMAYGNPDPYEEFKKGNYSLEAVTSALEKGNRTLDQLFEACRDEFATKAISLPLRSVISSLLKYDFGKSKALSLWQILDLTIQDVYDTPGLRQQLDERKKELNQVQCLGVLTNPNTITINKKVYDTWEEAEDLVQPFAESISHRSILQIVEKVDTDLENIILLKAAALEPYAATAIYIEQGKTRNDIKNCKFVTLENDTTVVSEVANAVNHVTDIHIPRGNVTNLILGSPLICQNKVYGLAREMEGDEIILDSFSGVSRMFSKSYLLDVAIAVYVCVCLL